MIWPVRHRLGLFRGKVYTELYGMEKRGAEKSPNWGPDDVPVMYRHFKRLIP